MDLKEYCETLSENKRFELATKICGKTLPIWEDYCNNYSLSYTDSVVGMHHEVRQQLLFDSVAFCENILRLPFYNKSEIDLKTLNSLLEEFSDPIVAMQDSDWELSYAAERTFFAVYNLLYGLKADQSKFSESFHYVSINQAGDAINESGLMSMEEIAKIIYP